MVDITERRRADEERQAHRWIMESLDRVNRAIQGTSRPAIAGSRMPQPPGITSVSISGQVSKVCCGLKSRPDSAACVSREDATVNTSYAGTLFPVPSMTLAAVKASIGPATSSACTSL